MVDFAHLLSKRLDDVEKPKPWPAGTYFGRVNAYKVDESREKKTPFIRMEVGIEGPSDDIPAEDVAGIDFGKRKFNKDFFLTPDADWRLKEFITSCGIPTQGRNFNETLPETIGQPVIVQMVQTPSRDGTDIYNNIGDMKGNPG